MEVSTQHRHPRGSVAVLSETATCRRARILAHLAEYPGLTSRELARALSIPDSLNRLMRDMEVKAQVVTTTEWRAQQGRRVYLWHVAPAGAVPPAAPSLTPEAAARRRERDRVSRRRSRAAARELAAAPAVAVLDAPLPPGAACAGADPDLFFPLPGDDDTKAKAICQACPIRSECYTLAAQRGERWGIWGGVNFDVTPARREAQAS